MDHSQRYIIEAKTANYTVANGDFGKILTTRGASGAVTFTLPAPTTTPSGVWVEFIQLAAQDMVITAGTDLISTFNDLTATSITFSTAGDEIGNAVRMVNDGTTWLAMLMIEGAVITTVA